LGHACGHNLIAVSSTVAAVILRKAFPRLKGSIEVIGCPAEERGGGKIILDNSGVFDHLDFAMLVHPSDRTEIYKLSLALIEINMEFIGKASHAAASPEKGINALDAAIQTFNAVNALRSRLTGFARVNGIITEGGKAPNIIPDCAKVEFWVRDDSLSKAGELADLVAKAGRASAKAVGAKAKIKIGRKLAYAPFLPNRVAGGILWQIFEKLGVKIEQGDEKAEMGSTDVGNLSWKVPALHPALAISRSPVHSIDFAKAAASGKAIKLMEKAALAMSILGYRVMTEPEFRKEMKAELMRNRTGK
jgi:amidohydrolase